MSKHYYLNDSSTAYNKTKEFNLSDSLYKENIDAKKKIRILENKIKKIVNAPDNAKVIFNSGATESIATCLHWVSVLNPYGIVVGSKYDHTAVKDNCDVYKLDYQQANLDNINKLVLDDRTSALMMTHVSGKTGEILEIDNIINNVDSYAYLRYDQNNPDDFYGINRKILQVKPMLFLDATQSITKLKINMTDWNLNAVFWSNHKIGGSIGRGVLVVVPTHDYPFVPLIAGAQNHNMRGGSISGSLILKDSYIYDHVDDINKRKAQWLASYEYLKSKGIKVYKPKNKHLYSTLLIDIGNKCPFSILSKLSKEYIYLSPKSACTVERKINEGEIEKSEWQDIYDKEIELDKLLEGGYYNTSIVPNVSGGDKQPKEFDNALRISFTDGQQIDGEVLNKIVKAINEEVNTSTYDNEQSLLN